MNAVAEKSPQAGAIAESNTVSMFERLARDPSVDVEKLERLMLMNERIMARNAETAFSQDLAEMQPLLPSIGERGDAAGRYKYALWEDINTAIKPILAQFGFALTFRTDFSAGIRVIGVLSHRGGHKETTDFVLPPDKSGNKNEVQAVASSVSYGKRYTAGALLNLTSHGEDDDAYRAAPRNEPAPANDTPERRELVRDLYTEASAGIEALKAKWIGLTAEQRKSVGGPEWERIKSTAAVPPETDQ